MNGNGPCRFHSSFQPRYLSFFRIFTKFIKNDRLCAPHEWLFVWHPCKNGLVSQRRMQTSARYDSPEISSVWLSLTSWAWLWLIWVIFWSCRRFSRRSARRFSRVYGSNFGHHSPPFLSLINSDLVRKLSTSSRFAFTYIRCYLFFTRS